MAEQQEQQLNLWRATPSVMVAEEVIPVVTGLLSELIANYINGNQEEGKNEQD